MQRRPPPQRSGDLDDWSSWIRRDGTGRAGSFDRPLSKTTKRSGEGGCVLPRHWWAATQMAAPWSWLQDVGQANLDFGSSTGYTVDMISLL